MAKTQYSFSTDPQPAGRADRPRRCPCARQRLSAGAGFIVVITGEIMTMPGLPRTPAAEAIGLDGEGHIVGLF